MMYPRLCGNPFCDYSCPCSCPRASWPRADFRVRVCFALCFFLGAAFMLPGAPARAPAGAALATLFTAALGGAPLLPWSARATTSLTSNACHAPSGLTAPSRVLDLSRFRSSQASGEPTTSQLMCATASRLMHASGSILASIPFAQRATRAPSATFVNKISTRAATACASSAKGMRPRP
eukprot:1262784-Prymnesium_polylepis.1